MLDTARGSVPCSLPALVTLFPSMGSVLSCSLKMRACSIHITRCVAGNYMSASFTVLLVLSEI